MSKKSLGKLVGVILTVSIFVVMSPLAYGQQMDKMWGESVVKLRAEDAARGQLFNEGNYAMFIHLVNGL